MANRVSENVAMLMRVVAHLTPLRERLVFLGGAVTELFITLPGARRPRQTKDVDVVIDVMNLGEYSDTLRKQLIGLGLREDDRDGAPLCRWLLEDMIIDIMPTRGDILGFPCTWHSIAYATATPSQLPDGTVIRLVTPACFLVTKLSAFADRGLGNPIASHDLEDIIAVIDGRSEIVSDVAQGPTALKTAIRELLEQLLDLPDAEDVIAAQLLPDAKSQERLPLVLARIRRLIGAAAE